jgi:hypothetical protein
MLLAAAATLALAGLGPTPARAEAKVGDAAPDLSGRWYNSPSAAGSLSDLKGRVVILEFMRTW